MYEIHDNGGRPFLVIINSYGYVTVYKSSNYGSMLPHDLEYDLEVFRFYPSQIFIGKLDNYYYHSEEGNTILLHLANHMYVFIGMHIYTFHSHYPIVKYQSPIGGSDVPYPWAIDSNHNYFLMIEHVICAHSEPLPANVNVYRDFYDRGLMSRDEGRIPPQEPPVVFRDIAEFFIGDDMYTLKYNVTPDLDYDRLIGWDEGDLRVIKRDGTECVLSRDDYIELMESFGELIGCKALEYNVIHRRM